MNKLIKIIFTLLLLVTVTMGFSTVAMADSDIEKQLITEMEQEIEGLGETPIKKGLKSRKKYISALEKQLEELRRQKEKEARKQALMDDLRKQILELNPDAKLDADESADAKDELDQDKDIIALKKELEDLKKTKQKADEKKKAEKKKAEEKRKAEKKKAEEKKKADEKKKAEEAKEKAKERRLAAIVRVKKEIYLLGGTPVAEFEVETQDAYIEALKNQIEELKKQKEAEEKEIAEAIPEWYLMPPQGSDVLMYVRGTAVSDQLQLALDFATNAALKNLGKKVETRVASKAKQTVRQAGIGEDQVSKTEINLISSTVMEEVTLSGYKTVETKLVSLDSGSYRAFILIEYPVAKAYKSYIEKIERSSKLKGRLTVIKNTDIFKELKKAVAKYSGS